MSDLAIRVSGLGKCYRLCHEARANRYQTLRDDIVRLPRRVWAKLRGAKYEEFWALHNVSFELELGEVVGVIGRNGAGKSTLLRILSRITPPTVGEVELFGRVGSLLEVGTGFHPELTGRENIFLSGAILGMRRPEIRRRFDEIVAFAEVEKFLDTPCKHYSSGMYMRLGFAVAAHLDAEILLVDEVLAVGDAEFQRKCLNKMGTVAKSGRTVLFVSHNLAAIEALCSHALLLNQGIIAAHGATLGVISAYRAMRPDGPIGEADVRSHPNRVPGSKPFFTHVRVFSDAPNSESISMGRGVTVEMTFAASEPFDNLQVGVTFNDLYGRRLVNFSPTHQAPQALRDAPRSGTMRCRIPWVNLLAGRYLLTVIASDDQGAIDRIDDCLDFEILPRDVFGTGRIPGPQHGVIYLESEWSVRSFDATRGTES